MDQWSSRWGTEELFLENRAGGFADLGGRAGRLEGWGVGEESVGVFAVHSYCGGSRWSAWERLQALNREAFTLQARFGSGCL
jgi:hypothetical protein